MGGKATSQFAVARRSLLECLWTRANGWPFECPEKKSSLWNWDSRLVTSQIAVAWMGQVWELSGGSFRRPGRLK